MGISDFFSVKRRRARQKNKKEGVQDQSWKKYPHTVGEKLIPGWKSYPHVVYWSMQIYETVMASNEESETKPRNMALSAPPRHCKSWLCMWASVLWYLVNWPDRHVAIATHTQKLSESYAKKVRASIERHEKLLGFGLIRGSKSAKYFEISTGGSVCSTSVGGDIQGRPVHFFSIDDIYKNRKQVNSEAYKQEVDDWFKYVVRTRLEQFATISVSCTRWSVSDQIGRIIHQAKSDSEADQYLEINSPAVWEKDEPDPMGRVRGQALCPERKSEKELLRIRKTLGEEAWASLYQGAPLSDFGKRIKRSWIRYFKISGDRYHIFKDDGSFRSVAIRACKHFQVIDSAIEEKQSADKTAIITFAITPTNDVLIVDVWADRIPGHEVWKKAKEKKLEFKWPGEPSYIEKQFIEATQGGKIAIMQAKEHGLVIQPVTPGHKDKKIRAGSMEVKYQNGEVFHLLDAPWDKGADSYTEELTEFPDYSTDDRFDCAAYMMLMMNSDSQWTEDCGFPFYGVLNGGVDSLTQINPPEPKKFKETKQERYRQYGLVAEIEDPLLKTEEDFYEDDYEDGYDNDDY